jgi:hypothetical protein
VAWSSWGGGKGLEDGSFAVVAARCTPRSLAIVRIRDVAAVADA